MEQEKRAITAVGVLVAVVLFVAVLLWFRQDRMAESPTPPAQKMTESEKSAAPALPVANPETPQDVAANIDAQLAADAMALDEEFAAEEAEIDADIQAINELSEAYDESAF